MKKGKTGKEHFKGAAENRAGKRQKPEKRGDSGRYVRVRPGGLFLYAKGR
jgi:hypothetical protein